MNNKSISAYTSYISIFLSSAVLLSACVHTPVESITSQPPAAQKHIFDIDNFKEDFPSKTVKDNLVPLLPKSQWNALYKKDLGHLLMININPDLSRISMALNCKDTDKIPFFLIEDSDGLDILSSSPDTSYQVDFILDNKTIKQPFKHSSSANFERFKQLFYTAKVIQIKAYVSEEYSTDSEQQKHSPVHDLRFQNRYAEIQKESSPICSSKDHT